MTYDNKTIYFYQVLKLQCGINKGMSQQRNVLLLRHFTPGPIIKN